MTSAVLLTPALQDFEDLVRIVRLLQNEEVVVSIRVPLDEAGGLRPRLMPSVRSAWRFECRVQSIGS